MSEGLVHILNLQEVLSKLDGKKLLAGPVKNFLTRCAIATLNKAKERAPVDTGRLWSSLTFQPGVNVIIDNAEIPSEVAVGTNVNAEGFPYPKALDEGDQYHYRGKGEQGGKSWGLVGQPTKGWFSDVPSLLGEEYRELSNTLAEEIAAEWG